MKTPLYNIQFMDEDVTFAADTIRGDLVVDRIINMTTVYTRGDNELDEYCNELCNSKVRTAILMGGHERPNTVEGLLSYRIYELIMDLGHEPVSFDLKKGKWPPDKGVIWTEFLRAVAAKFTTDRYEWY